jgi:hypothetical protein
MALQFINIGKPTPTKPSAPLAPVVNFTTALQHTFGSTLKGMPYTGMSPIPAHRPKIIMARSSGHVLAAITPPVLKSDPRLTSEIRATPHPDILVFPPHPIVTPIRDLV